MDGILGAGMARPGATSRRFDEYYRCYPVAMLPGPERENVNHGGKVIMPPSALDKLTRLHITYPMLFELHNGAKERMTHAGVLEFIAEEGKIYLPFWVSKTDSSTCCNCTKTRFATADANITTGTWRSSSNQIDRPPSWPVHQTPSTVDLLPRY